MPPPYSAGEAPWGAAGHHYPPPHHHPMDGSLDSSYGRHDASSPPVTALSNYSRVGCLLLRVCEARLEACFTRLRLREALSIFSLPLTIVLASFPSISSLCSVPSIHASVGQFRAAVLDGRVLFPRQAPLLPPAAAAPLSPAAFCSRLPPLRAPPRLSRWRRWRPLRRVPPTRRRVYTAVCRRAPWAAPLSPERSTGKLGRKSRRVLVVVVVFFRPSLRRRCVARPQRQPPPATTAAAAAADSRHASWPSRRASCLELRPTIFSCCF